MSEEVRILKKKKAFFDRMYLRVGRQQVSGAMVIGLRLIITRGGFVFISFLF